MPGSKGRPEVVHFQRKRRKDGNFSLEFIFEDVRSILDDQVDFKVVCVPFLSNGIIKRLKNARYAARRQGQINHITGDVHYLNLFFKKSRCILTILDCGFMHVPNPLLRYIYKLFWLTLPEKKAQYITAISEATKRDIIRYTDCDPDKVIVIPVAVPDHFKPVPKLFNRERPVLLQIGTAPNKNITRLAEAIQGMNCQLVIIGFLSEELKQHLAACRIDYVNKTNLTAEEIYAAYIDSDIVTFVSTFEGFGMPIIEANCVERVVITGNTTSMPEVAGNAACVVNPFSVEDIRNGIQHLIEDEGCRESLIENGRKNRERFGRVAIANMYMDLYQRLALQ